MRPWKKLMIIKITIKSCANNREVIKKYHYVINYEY